MGSTWVQPGDNLGLTWGQPAPPYRAATRVLPPTRDRGLLDTVTASAAITVTVMPAVVERQGDGERGLVGVHRQVVLRRRPRGPSLSTFVSSA